MPVTEGRAVAEQQRESEQPSADGIDTAIAAGEIDTSVAHPARVYDYRLGGTSNYPADREAAERVLAATPGLRWRVKAAGARAGHPGQAQAQRRYNERVATPQTLRGRTEVGRFFRGTRPGRAGAGLRARVAARPG
jgi:hypothetical protein